MVHLIYAGNPKIIHRDIKAANILLDFNFEAKVGICKLHGHNEEPLKFQNIIYLL